MKIILTGGGTAGHVTPNIALIPKLIQNEYEVFYIGSKNGIEKKLIEEQNIPFKAISSGKLRRYLDFKNVSDAAKVVKGVGDAIFAIRKIKPNIVFSKGGFVAVPVVIAAKLLNVPVVIHESDFSSGLANKISIPFAKKVCTSFPETVHEIPENKGIVTGTPIRNELYKGSKEKGLEICNFNSKKPVMLVMGGSLGAVKINNCLRKNLDELTKKFQIVHLCGKNNLDLSINNSSYIQFEYVSKQLTDIFACTDIIVSRAGANSIFEFLALKKPNLLIPLSKNASRGDQIVNANSFERHGYSKVLMEEALTAETLLSQVNQLYNERKTYIIAMQESDISDGVDAIINIIKDNSKK